VRHGSVKRVASAVGAGAIAIQSVHEHFVRAKLGLDNSSSAAEARQRSDNSGDEMEKENRVRSGDLQL
jgi:hypothetical protein